MTSKGNCDTTSTAHLGGNFTFLILADRDDLDTQIYKTFAGCGVVDNDRDPGRSSCGDHLSRLLAQHKSHTFSLIQKCNQVVNPDEGYTKRDDIIVITDEAHRTQYGTLARVCSPRPLNVSVQPWSDTRARYLHDACRSTIASFD
jgi:type I site-specific restriction-modification system R (restriction) subunit